MIGGVGALEGRGVDGSVEADGVHGLAFTHKQNTGGEGAGKRGRGERYAYFLPG